MKAVIPVEAAKSIKAVVPIEAAKSRIEAAYCHAPATKPWDGTMKAAAKTTAHMPAAKTTPHMPATKTTAAHARENWAARNQGRAECGRGQQYTEAFHIILLPEVIFVCGA